ncbi:hypothetical protein GCM10007972_25710 [Iodidimonas muriae]|uniref:MobA-like NTP transferase domain-containing protein n=1 Tax=Iodidimonas muriae TaxID=261467 RepID=A0ABQ2LGA7_9PROT|nr:nucleotidyltransferase family protein [Iodidimonas muriae]GGO16533.1 hypothetical protein GCM10007972_25710 [Iodidimonas muriae]
MPHKTAPAQPFTALVLAASRRGPDDPVARLQQKSHKCFVDIAGQVMLERVIDTLLESQQFRTVLVSIEQEELLHSTARLKAWMDEGRIAFVQSEGTLADSVMAAAKAMDAPFPMVITTGDNSLHTPQLLRDFCESCRNSTSSIGVGITPEKMVKDDYPDAPLAYHRFSEGAYSNCNLYMLRDKQALASAEAFRGGGQFGKKHARLIKAFGFASFLYYKMRLKTAADFLMHVGRRFGTTAEPIIVPYAFAPIDVDNAASFKLSEDILLKRQKAAQ